MTSGVRVSAGEEGVRVLDATYEPTAGSARVTVTPVGEPTDDGAYPADAVLTLSEVTLIDLGIPTQVGSISTLEIRAHIGEPWGMLRVELAAAGCAAPTGTRHAGTTPHHRV